MNIVSRQCIMKRIPFFRKKGLKKDLSFTRVRAKRESFNGMWLSLVERCVRDAETACSNHAIPTTR